MKQNSQLAAAVALTEITIQEAAWAVAAANAGTPESAETLIQYLQIQNNTFSRFSSTAPTRCYMNYIDYERQTTRKGELMSKEKPLIDYVNNRRTDAEPEYQDGSGAIFWLAVCAVCWIIALCLAGHAGYFN